MATTATYILKAVVDGETYLFHYDHCYDSWAALEQFWHDDYPATLISKGGGLFTIHILSMLEGKVISTHRVTFNAGVFHAFFDHGHTVDGIYTLDQFAKDIERKPEDKPSPKQLKAMMDRWAGFCHNHPPYEEVILWMVGGSKQHYIYQHFCSKFSHLCDLCHDDTMGAWMKFYRELDSEWAERLLDYVYNVWKRDKQ